MRCTWCVTQMRDTIWATTGSGNFCLKTVHDHAQLSAHLLAAAANGKTQGGVVPGMAATVAKRHSAVKLAKRLEEGNEEISHFVQGHRTLLLFKRKMRNKLPDISMNPLLDMEVRERHATRKKACGR